MKFAVLPFSLAVRPRAGRGLSLAVYSGAATGGLDLVLDVTGYFR